MMSSKRVSKRYAWKRIRRYEQVEIINQRQDLPFLQQWRIVEMAAKIIFFVCSTPPGRLTRKTGGQFDERECGTSTKTPHVAYMDMLQTVKDALAMCDTIQKKIRTDRESKTYFTLELLH
jgi:hypothetical protein